jgi:hypothetical protein
MGLVGIRKFLAENLGTLFMMLFAALTLTCAYILIRSGSGNPNIDSVAIAAYSSLAVGIFLQAVGFIRTKCLESV